MDYYTNEEKLTLTDKVYITAEVKQMLKELKKIRAKNNTRESMAKTVCNLIIKECEQYGITR